jgi:protein-S-isoprenylcysteine O-methyltransferase Ste14
MNPPAVFALHLVAMTALHFGAPGAVWNLGATRWWGLPFVVAGLILVLHSASRFRGRTTIRPFESSQELVASGFYRFSRNPMYLGLVASTIGAFILLGSATPGLGIPSLVWILRKRFIEAEERGLEEQFGEAYRAYKTRVRRWL